MQQQPHRILGQNLESDGTVQYLVMKGTCSSFCHHTDVKNFPHQLSSSALPPALSSCPSQRQGHKEGKDGSSGTGSRRTRKNGEQLPSTGNSWDALLPEILAEEKETETDTHNNYFLLHYNK